MRILVVDDEALARSRLRRMLERMAVTVIGEASNGKEALEKVEALSPDLLLLDVEMPELDGFGVAHALSIAGPRIIFVTAYDEHALRAFEVAAIDYLLKPVKEERLAAALRRASRGNLTESYSKLTEAKKLSRLAVKVGSKYLVIDVGDISTIVSQDHYSCLQVGGKEYLLNDPLEHLAKRLPEGFIRISRGAIVNTDFLKALHHEGDRKYRAILGDEKRSSILISRERLSAVKEVLGLS